MTAANPVAPPPSTSYSLNQSLRYEYPGPIRHLAHRLMVVPPSAHGDQRRLSHRVEVRGVVARVTERVDGFGNHVVDVRADRVEEAVEFDAWVRVERAARPVAAGAAVGDLSDRRFLGPSPLTTADDRLRQAARDLTCVAGGDARALADRVCEWVNSAITYDGDATDVWTTAAGALDLGRGVCQDYAHVMLSVLRLCRLPARYVSGHLRGEGGTHAWVEVLVPDGDGGAEAVALDPTHARAPGPGYVTVAVGRDYGDVAPTSGTYDAPWVGRLSISKRLVEEDLELSPT